MDAWNSNVRKANFDGGGSDWLSSNSPSPSNFNKHQQQHQNNNGEKSFRSGLMASVTNRGDREGDDYDHNTNSFITDNNNSTNQMYKIVGVDRKAGVIMVKLANNDVNK